MRGRNYTLFLLAAGVLCFGTLDSGLIWRGNLSNANLCCVHAEGQSIQYSYDSLGRVTSAVYPDGTTIDYIYDKNGNLLSSTKKGIGSQDGGSTAVNPGSSGTGNTSATTNSSNTGTASAAANSADNGKTTATTNVPGTGNAATVSNKQKVSTSSHYTAQEIKRYNQFKKKKGKIKSLKLVKKKKKYYLKITVKRIYAPGTYGETGYQVKYAANKSFKKAKSVKFSRKKSLTSKSWKVSKGKTYYVKVRAYMKTRTGKTIYTKYSAIKKIKVK